MMFSAAYALVSGNPAVPWAWLLFAALAFYNYPSIDPNLRVVDTPTEEIHSEYDFIIVGAGSAGSVLASRLTEVEDWSVLLLEAGEDETALTEVPALSTYLRNTDLDWQFKTEPSDRACLAQPNARCDWPRGKVLGGSSSINGMLYVRGNKRDYDYWESLGNPGWSYKNALYYFKKSEGIQIPELEDSIYHSTDGPLTVSQVSYMTPLAPAFLQACEEMGYLIRDVNGEFQTGFMKIQTTTRDGHRCSTAKAFLRPARDRKNLHIAMRSYVTKVLVNPDTKIAYGVEYARDGTTYTVTARKEVILSAGAIQSPQLLMLSGIGPKADLQKLSIPVLQDLKVGYNLQDHVQFLGIAYRITEPVFANDTRLDIANAVLEWAKAGTGPLTLRKPEVLGNVQTSYANATDDWPDVQFAIFPIYTLNTSATDTQAENLVGSLTGGANKRSINKSLLDSFATQYHAGSSTDHVDRVPFKPNATLHLASASTSYVNQFKPSTTQHQAGGSTSFVNQDPSRSAPTQSQAKGLTSYLSRDKFRPIVNPDQAGDLIGYVDQDPLRPFATQGQADGTAGNLDQSSLRSIATQDLAVGSAEDLDQSSLRPIAIQDLAGDLTADLDQNPHRPTDTNDGWGMNVALLHPKSRGRVKLQSKSPFVYPLLIHNYFTQEIDLLTLIEGVKIALGWGQTRAMQQFGSTFNYNNPNCSHIPLYTDAYWACAIRYDSATVYHQVGTCKMGPYWDPDAVVDPQLRVYGIERLRVIDASIMPTVPSGNTNAPSIMIGEKGADMVKETWRRS